MTTLLEQLQSQLAAARAGECRQIAHAIRGSRVVGVLGEAETGKTAALRQLVATSSLDADVLRVDFAAAASPEHLAFLVAKALARAAAGPSGLSQLSVDAIVPASVLARRVELVDLLGMDGFDEALRDWPSGRYSLDAALDALQAYLSRRPVLLWLDHLESPALTARHPLDVDRVLWGLREILQRSRRLRLLVSARLAHEPDLLGPRAALHQHGKWMTMENPPLESWLQVGAGHDLPTATIHQLVAATDGHPQVTLLALSRLIQCPRERRPRVDDLLHDLATHDEGLAMRTVQHARTLHRLGSQVLTQVAMGEPPYGNNQRGAVPAQEIRKVLNRLRLAGILRRSTGWMIVNPLVAMRLRSAARGVVAAVDREG